MQTITILATFQQPQVINITTPTSGTNPATRLNVRQVILEDLPILENGELAFTIDEKSFYVGAEEGNQRFLNESQIEELAVGEHTHSESDITDLDKYTQEEINQLLSAFVTSVNGYSGEVNLTASDIGAVSSGDLTGSNVGDGVGTYYDIAGAELQFRSIKAGDNVEIIEDEDGAILISATAGGEGIDGASIVSAVFEGDDIVFTKDDDSTVILANAKTTLRGDQGDGGEQGLQGETGNDGAEVDSVEWVNDDMVFTKSDSSTFTLTDAKIDLKGDAGDNGDNGIGVPEGGTAGQVLSKIDETNFNTEWVDQGGGDGVSGIKALKLAFISL